MSQLFIQIPNKSILLNLLNSICKYDINYYILNKTAFKLAIYKDLLKQLYQELKPFYHKSKQFYINREPTYKNFLTIIRQLCNCLNINFIYFNYFHNSTYDVVYKISKNN